MGISFFEPDTLTLIAGPCVLENYSITKNIAETVAEIAQRYGFNYIFKASFDKANRTALQSYRGPGLQAGLEMLEKIKQELSLAVVTDIHERSQIAPAAQVVDMLQIPAFLCRQTDLLVEAGQTNKAINIKKGQFMAPQDMQYAVEKVKSGGTKQVSLTERGTSFGYQNLVVDMRGMEIMRTTSKVPIIFDATHSVQLPGGGGGKSSGQREFVPLLSRAAIAVGIDGLYCEVHPDPSQAKSDGPNSLDFQALDDLCKHVSVMHHAYCQLR